MAPLRCTSMQKIRTSASKLTADTYETPRTPRTSTSSESRSRTPAAKRSGTSSSAPGVRKSRSSPQSGTGLKQLSRAQLRGDAPYIRSRRRREAGHAQCRRPGMDAFKKYIPTMVGGSVDLVRARSAVRVYTQSAGRRTLTRSVLYFGNDILKRCEAWIVSHTQRVGPPCNGSLLRSHPLLPGVYPIALPSREGG